MARLKLIKHDDMYVSFELDTSNLPKGVPAKINEAIAKKDGEAIDSEPLGTGFFSGDNIIIVLLRSPVEIDNLTKARRRAIERIKDVLTRALSYVKQNHDGICEEAGNVLEDCLDELKNLK